MKYKAVNIQAISVFNHPLIFLELLIQVVLDGFKAIQNLIITKWIVFLILIVSWILLCTVDSLSVNYNIHLEYQSILYFRIVLDHFRSSFFNWTGNRASYICSVSRTSYCKSCYHCQFMWLSTSNDSIKMGIRSFRSMLIRYNLSYSKEMSLKKYHSLESYQQFRSKVSYGVLELPWVNYHLTLLHTKLQRQNTNSAKCKKHLNESKKRSKTMNNNNHL